MTTGNKVINDFLSKSLFIRGLQCPKSLYLHKYNPELRDEMDDSQAALFQSGTEVGVFAQKLFPGGVEIPYVENDYQGQVDKTAEEIAKGTTTLYEATFSFDNVFIKADILKKGNSGWELYEVKSSTKVKDVYIDDVAIQYYVLTGSGLKISKASVVYINSEYTRNGDIDVNQLFTIEDVTDRIKEKVKEIAVKIEALRMTLAGDIPKIDIGPHCSDPYECDFIGHCWQHIPDNSVFDLRGKGVDKFEFYQKGIVKLQDLSLDDLNYNQRMQTEAFLGKKDFIDPEGLKEFLNSLSYPLYFLDFETFMEAVPPFNGTYPYQQIPFQYSLHWREHKDAELKHAEYLAQPGMDPRKDLTEKLTHDIPDNACVLAYHKSFETKVLRSMSEWFPEYATKIDQIIENMQDLAVPFKRRYVYSWKMNGAWSIKQVLPALLPEMSYDELEVSDGGLAMEAYRDMCQTTDPNEVTRLRNALLEYCKLDTLAMVRILEKLQGITS